jgi:polyisoprenoid-binding protein YceI
MHRSKIMSSREEGFRYVPRQAPTAAVDGDLERWEIDPATSHLRFVLRHIVVQEIRGRFQHWGGTLFLHRAQPELSSVRVWVDLASIDTDSPERDDHVRSAEFFDVARFPRAEFESSSVELGHERVVLRGLLDLHGAKRDVELEVGPRSGPTDGVRNAYRVRGTINRQAFGLHWNQDLEEGGTVVGDEVEFEADVEIVRAEENASSEL